MMCLCLAEVLKNIGLDYVLCSKTLKSGTTLKKEKCEFGVTEVKFLGHIFCLAGVNFDPDKAKTIMEIMPPSCKREAKRFFGMVYYQNKFSSRLAELCSPIYETTRSNSILLGY